MRSVLACSIALAALISGCGKSRGLRSKEAIQAAIERHLQSQPQIVLNNMTLEVQDVKFDAGRAEAEVKFRSKQSPDLAVGVHYVLRRVGDRWEVESSSATSGMGSLPHAGAGTSTPSPTQTVPQPSH